MLLPNGTGLAWDRTQQQRMNPGVVNGWRFQTTLAATKYAGGGTNAVDAGFLTTDGEPVCAILTAVYDLEAYRRNKSDPTATFEDVWPTVTGELEQLRPFLRPDWLSMRDTIDETAKRLGALQKRSFCDVLDRLFLATLITFVLTWLLLLGKCAAAYASVRAGTAELQLPGVRNLQELDADFADGMGRMPLSQLLRHPLTRRGIGFSEVSAVSAFFVPLIMSDDEARSGLSSAVAAQ